MNFNKKQLFVNTFFMPQFNYCPLILMCQNDTNNNKIQKKPSRGVLKKRCSENI